MTFKSINQADPRYQPDEAKSPDIFRFAVIGARTGGMRPGFFDTAMRKINWLRPDFAVSIGSHIEGYTIHEDFVERQWDEVEALIRPLLVPLIRVPGLHDVSNEMMTRVWQRRYGDLYFHFTIHNVLCLFLNSMDNAKHVNIGPSQIDYVKKTLAANQDVTWTLVFIHDSLWWFDWNTGWGDIERLLQDRPYTVFSDGYHLFMKSERDGAEYYQMGATGASVTEGTFDHIALVTMTDRGPVVANLLIDGILSGDARTDTDSIAQSYKKKLRAQLEGVAKREGTWK